jgi:uncharacterized membrane protein
LSRAGLFKLIREHLGLLVANAVAIYIMIFGWNYYDVSYFIDWYRYAVEGKLLELYAQEVKVAYPPLAVLVFIAPHAVATGLFGENLLAQVAIDKLPLLVGFNATYFILRRNYGKLAGRLWLFTVVAYTVLMTYQFDVLVAPLILLALLSFEKEKFERGAIYLALASLIKQALAVLGIIPIIYLAKKRKFKTIFTYIGAAVITVAVIIAPFFIVSPWSFIEKALLFHEKRPPQQLSAWATIIYLYNYDLQVIELMQSISRAWLYLYVVFLVVIAIKAYREVDSCKSGFYLKYCILTLVGFLMLSKVGNINYFLWVAPLLIVFISKLNKVELRERLSALYIFMNLVVGLMFGFLSDFVFMVAGADIFIFEDLSWKSSHYILYQSYRADPLNTYYKLVLYLHAIPAIREAAAAIVATHTYFLILLTAIYLTSLLYFARVTYKYATCK